MNESSAFRDWLIDQADQNLAQAITHRIHHSSNGSLKEENGVLMFTIGRPSSNGHFNGLLQINNKIRPEKVIAMGQEFFASLDVDYTIWIRGHTDGDLERVVSGTGYRIRREPGSPGMFVRHPYDSITIPPEVEIRQVITDNDAKEYAEITSLAFDIPRDLGQAVFASVNALNARNVRAFVAYQKGQPVAAAMVVITGDVAGIYWVGTVPEARGQGLGEICTKIVTNAGFEEGAEAVVLQASAAGEPIYRRIGYQTFTRYKWYFLPA